MFGETETEPGGFSQRLGSDHGFSGFDETRNVTACVCWDSHDRGRVHGETGGGLVRHRLGGQEEYDSVAAAMGHPKVRLLFHRQMRKVQRRAVDEYEVCG